jgi:ribosomal protein L7Ae-like RNA K-turn-binding protein
MLISLSQDVKFREIMGVLREIAEKEGYVHKSFIENMKEVGKLSQIVRHKMVEKILDKKSEDLKVDPKDLLNNLEL